MSKTLLSVIFVVCRDVEFHDISQNIMLIHYTENIMLVGPSEQELASILRVLGAHPIAEVSSLIILFSYLGLSKIICLTA